MTLDAPFVFLVFSCLIYLLASGGLVPFVARAKNRSGIGWMVSSLLFSPLLALIALAALPPGTADEPVSSFDAELRRR